MVRWAVGVLAVAFVVSGCGASKHLPTVGGEVRPATWGNGDGSYILGGPEGTGRAANLGHIRWTDWTATEALGWGVGWDRMPKPCADTSRGCHDYDPFFYKLDSKQHVRIRASDPVRGVFRHLMIGRACWLYSTSGEVFYASCRTWRRS